MLLKTSTFVNSNCDIKPVYIHDCAWIIGLCINFTVWFIEALLYIHQFVKQKVFTFCWFLDKYFMYFFIQLFICFAVRWYLRHNLKLYSIKYLLHIIDWGFMDMCLLKMFLQNMFLPKILWYLYQSLGFNFLISH